MPGTPTSRSKSAPTPTLIPLGRHTGKPPLPLTRPVILIGSRSNARIRLASSTVSKAHALLVLSDGAYYIRDLSSRTHVYINSQQIEGERTLVDGDRVTIGSFEFQYNAGPLADRLLQRQPVPAGMLRVDGVPAPVPLYRRVMLFGRRPTVDVPLTEASVSTAHAVVFEMTGRRQIRDLGSRTGTFVNGVKIHQHPLTVGDTVKIGDTTFRYEHAKNVNAAAERSAAVAVENAATEDLIRIEDDEPASAARVGSDTIVEAEPEYSNENTGDFPNEEFRAGDLLAGFGTRPEKSAEAKAPEPTRPAVPLLDAVMEITPPMALPGSPKPQPHVADDEPLPLELEPESPSIAAEKAGIPAADELLAVEPPVEIADPGAKELGIRGGWRRNTPSQDEAELEALPLDEEPVQQRAPEVAKSAPQKPVDDEPLELETEALKFDEPTDAGSPAADHSEEFVAHEPPADEIDIERPVLEVETPADHLAGAEHNETAIAKSEPADAVEPVSLDLTIEPTVDDLLDLETVESEQSPAQPMGLRDAEIEPPPVEAPAAEIDLSAARFDIAEPSAESAEAVDVQAESTDDEVEVPLMDPSVAAVPVELERPLDLTGNSDDDASSQLTEAEASAMIDSPPAAEPSAPALADGALAKISRTKPSKKLSEKVRVTRKPRGKGKTPPPAPDEPPIQPAETPWLGIEEEPEQAPRKPVRAPIVGRLSVPPVEEPVPELPRLADERAPADEIIPATEPTPESAFDLAEGKNQTLDDSMAGQRLEETVSDSRESLSDTSFGKAVNEFTSQSTGDLVEQPPAPKKTTKPPKPVAEEEDDFLAELGLDEPSAADETAPVQIPKGSVAPLTPAASSPVHSLPPVDSEDFQDNFLGGVPLELPPLEDAAQPAAEFVADAAVEDAASPDTSEINAAVADEEAPLNTPFAEVGIDSADVPLDPVLGASLDDEQMDELNLENATDTFVEILDMNGSPVAPAAASPAARQRPETPVATPASEAPAKSPSSPDGKSPGGKRPPAEVKPNDAYKFIPPPPARSPRRRRDAAEPTTALRADESIPPYRPPAAPSKAGADPLAGFFDENTPVREMDVFSQMSPPGDDPAPAHAPSGLVGGNASNTGKPAGSDPFWSGGNEEEAAAAVEEMPAAETGESTGKTAKGADTRRPPEFAKPDEAARTRRRRLWRVPFLMIVMLALMGGSLFAIQKYVPRRASVEAAVKFRNFVSMTKADQDVLEKQQRAFLRDDNTRQDAKNALVSERSTIDPSWLLNPTQFASLIDVDASQFNRDRGAFVISVPRARADDDKPRIKAIARALYNANRTLLNEAARAKSNLETLDANITSSKQKLEDLQRQIEKERTLSQNRPDAASIAALMAEVKQLDAARQAAMTRQFALSTELKQLEAAIPAAAQQPAATLAADDGRVREMKQELDALLAKDKEAHDQRLAASTEARKSLDNAFKEFETQLQGARAKTKDNPELSQYVVAAQQFFDRTRKVVDDMLNRQQALFTQLTELRDSLNSDIEARRRDAWQNDTDLQRYALELQLAKRQLNAAIGGGEKKEADNLSVKVQLLETSIRGRQELLPKDAKMADLANQLEQIMVNNRKNLEADRKQTDELLAELQQKFVANSQSAENVPAEQKTLMAELDKRLNEINAARTQYAEAAASMTDETDEASKQRREQIAMAQTAYDTRLKQLASDEAKKLGEQAELQRQKEIGAKREEVAAAMQAATDMRNKFFEREKALHNAETLVADARESEGRIATLTRDQQAVTARLKTDNDQLGLAKETVASLVEPMDPTDGDVREVALEDQSDLYRYGSLAGLLIVFVPLISWNLYLVHRDMNAEPIAVGEDEELGSLPVASLRPAMVTSEPLLAEEQRPRAAAV